MEIAVGCRAEGRQQMDAGKMSNGMERNGFMGGVKRGRFWEAVTGYSCLQQPYTPRRNFQFPALTDASHDEEFPEEEKEIRDFI